MNFISYLTDVTDKLKHMDFTLGSVKLNLYSMLVGLLLITLMLWGAGLALRLLERRLLKVHNLRSSTRALIMKLLQITLYIVVFLTSLQIFGISLTAFSVIGGALGVGIGFGLQKIASNFMSGLILLYEHSIEVGDVIELTDGTVGVIRAMRARYTLVETGDSRDILIPNEDFITQRVVSLTHSNQHARIEIRVNVHFEDDVERALQLLPEACKSVKRCMSEPSPAAHIITFTDTAVTLALYFWIDDVAQGRQQPRTQAYLAIWRLLRENNIRIPYPAAAPTIPLEQQTVIMKNTK